MRAGVAPCRQIAGVGLVLLSLAAGAAAQEEAAGQEEHEADHQALRELKAVFEKAASENQLELLKPHLHEPFSVVTYTDREFSDFEAFQARWQKTRDEIVGKDGSYQVTLKPELSEIYGDMAVAHGDSDNVLVNSSGKEFRFTSHWTAVLRKVDGEWKIVRAHSSLDPFGNPMLVDGVTQKLVQAGIAAGAAGLLLGVVATYLWSARRARRASTTT